MPWKRILAVALGVLVLAGCGRPAPPEPVVAQPPAHAPLPVPPREPWPRGPSPGWEAPPPPVPMLLVGALDADRDGVISAQEIANAPTALKALDRNRDGKITREETFPQPPRGWPPGGPWSPGMRRPPRPR